MLWARLKRAVLETNLDALTGPRRLVVASARLAYLSVHKLRLDMGLERAAALSFVSILSLIPLAILFFSFVNLVGVSQEITAYLKSNVFPLAAPDFTKQLSAWLDEYLLEQQAFRDSFVSIVGFVAILSLIPAALAVVATAERQFNRIWKVRDSRSYLQRFATFWVVLTTSPFILIASTWLLRMIQSDGGWVDRLTFAHGYGYLDFWRGLGTILVQQVYVTLVPTMIGFIAFTLLYVYLPYAAVRLTSAAIGGVVAAVLWEFARRSFFLYVERSDSLYADLATVPLCLVWIYVNWLVVLIGCEVAYVHQNLLGLRDSAAPRSRPSRILVGFEYMERVVSAFAQSAPAPSVEEFAAEHRFETALVEETVARLVNAGLLVEVGSGRGTHALTGPPAETQLATVFDALGGGDAAASEFLLFGVAARPANGADASGAILGRAGEAYREVLDRGSLADLLGAMAGAPDLPPSGSLPLGSLPSGARG